MNSRQQMSRNEEILSIENLFSKKGTFKYSGISYIICYFDLQMVFGFCTTPSSKIVSKQVLLVFILHENELPVHCSPITVNT